jgi:hypothetical protein
MVVIWCLGFEISPEKNRGKAKGEWGMSGGRLRLRLRLRKQGARYKVQG